MIPRDIVDRLLVEVLEMRVLNPRCEIDRSKVIMCPTYKRVRQMQRHIFGFWASKMIKYKL
jgi:hypothetical protein